MDFRPVNTVERRILQFLIPVQAAVERNRRKRSPFFVDAIYVKQAFFALREDRTEFAV